MGNESLYIARIFRLQEKKKEKVCQKWPELFLSPVSPGVQIIPRSYSECYKSSVKIEKFRDLKVPRRRKFPPAEKQKHIIKYSRSLESCCGQK